METIKTLDSKGNLYIQSKDGLTFTIKECGDIKNMGEPVECLHCGKFYDLHTVKVNHRYADCSQFTTPCCNYKFADDREFKSFKDFKRVNLKEIKIIK